MMSDIQSLVAAIQAINADEITLPERVSLFNLLSGLAASFVPFDHPTLNVRLVSHQHLVDNHYNPNKVAPPEFKLLRQSILKDGLTMPVVVGRQAESDELVIIDGYHRCRLIQQDETIRQSLGGYVPVVVLDKTLDQRMSSSVRHNMARGTHQVELTAQLVMKLKELDWSNEDIGRELGMDSDEVLRMQQITGLAAAFKDNTFSTAWE